MKVKKNAPYTCHTPLESYDSQLSEYVWHQLLFSNALGRIANLVTFFKAKLWIFIVCIKFWACSRHKICPILSWAQTYVLYGVTCKKSKHLDQIWENGSILKICHKMSFLEHFGLVFILALSYFFISLYISVMSSFFA